MVLTFVRIVWIALFWALRKPSRSAAAAGLLLGAIPRAYLALGTVPRAWMASGPAWAYLLSFYALTVLWFVLLGALAANRAAVALKLAFPMMVLAAIEAIGALIETADLLSALVAGSVPSSAGDTALHLAFAIAQVVFLRGLAKEHVSPTPSWNRL